MDEDFIKLVKQMRNAQKDYFKTRSRDALKLSKDLEKLVDTQLEVLTGQRLI